MEIRREITVPCGKPARWVIKGGGFRNVYLCEEHHAKSDIMRLVRIEAGEMESVTEEGKKCQAVIYKRKAPGKYPRRYLKSLFG